MFVLKKLANPRIWKRIWVERLTEPLHLNLASLFVAAFGGFRARVEYDLVVRHHHAFAILKSADLARRLGIAEVTLIEFGVAAGAGLLNMCRIAAAATRETGVRFRIVGFDTGEGMPPPESYKDHPELYRAGDFPMDVEGLRRALPENAELVLGPVSETVPAFLQRLAPAAPIGFVSLDLDYYSSTKVALGILRGAPGLYLPRVPVYVDDVEDDSHNSFCGELLALEEFNAENALRKVEPHRFLRGYRIFRNARWIDHMFFLHVLDHPERQPAARGARAPVVLKNPYLD